MGESLNKYYWLPDLSGDFKSNDSFLKTNQINYYCCKENFETGKLRSTYFIKINLNYFGFVKLNSTQIYTFPSQNHKWRYRGFIHEDRLKKQANCTSSMYTIENSCKNELPYLNSELFSRFTCVRFIVFSDKYERFIPLCGCFLALSDLSVHSFTTYSPFTFQNNSSMRVRD